VHASLGVSLSDLLFAGAAHRDDNYQFTELELVSPEEAPVVPLSHNRRRLWPTFSSSHLLEADDEVEACFHTLREGLKVTRGVHWRHEDEGQWYLERF
jgi:hypothetical protein